MARQFSRGAVEDLRHVIREALKSRSWEEVSVIFGRVSRFKLHKFISHGRPDGNGTEGYVPPLVDLRAMVDGLADSLDSSAVDLRRDCPVQIEALLDVRPPPDPFAPIKGLAGIDDTSLRNLSRDLAGSYLCFRRHPRAGVLISHLRINDSFDRRGLILCEFRQDVHGDVYVIKALLFGKDEFVYVAGNDERYGLMRSLTLAHVARGSRQLYGIVSGVEPAGPPFAARMLLIRVESDFEALRSETGHVEDLAAAETIAARHSGTVDLLSRCRITADDGYFSAPLDFF